MSLLVVGLSHESAPLDLLERIAARPDSVNTLHADVIQSQDVDESMVIATCNRLEIIADVGRFHGAVSDIAAALARAGDLDRASFSDHLYVHYDERAVHHLFSMTCGLNSMAVGEPQVLGQVRQAFVRAQRLDSLGPVLNPLLQHALKVGKRAHAETDLDAVARSLVQRGLMFIMPLTPPLKSARTVIVGAGAMSALAASTLRSAGAGNVRIVNRDPVKAAALADRHGAISTPWSDLLGLLSTADLVISCTGASGTVIDRTMVAEAQAVARDSHQVTFLDLSMPADVDPSVTTVSGVHRIGLADLHQSPDDFGPATHATQVLQQVRDLVTSEVAAYQAGRQAEAVAPTVAALRARAGVVLEGEMDRLKTRLPDLDDRDAAEIRRAMSRVVDKLLHTPTVRAKALQSGEEPGDYARVLHELFDLDPRETATVQIPPSMGPGERR